MNPLQIASNAIQGVSNPLEAYIQLKRIEKQLADCIKSIQGLALEEAMRYPEKVINAYDAKIEKKRAPGRWDFTDIKEWLSLKEQLKELEENCKLAFKGKTIVSSDGEVLPPAKYTEGADIISIKI
jgi:hypothetical protein